MSRIDVLLPLIGKLNYCWTNTESLLIYLIVDMMKCSKEAAIIVFLTLNTTRARLDLVERLAKMTATPPAKRSAVLDITGRMKREAKVRNKYNHSVFDFDENGELESTQLLRIAEFGNELKYGKVEELDNSELQRLADTIEHISVINQDIWLFVRANNIKDL
ncbi:MAG: hypothetical protein JWP99_223 [Devosia sp.]|nr:hypothetical protein [Devosia sp.]